MCSRTDARRFKWPIVKFVREAASQDLRVESRAANAYSSIVNIDNAQRPSLIICPHCGIQITDESTHILSTIHQVAISSRPTAQPIGKLAFDEQSAGFRYLLKYGWSPHQRQGLGAEGREGKRDFIRSKKKHNRRGVGSGYGAVKLSNKPEGQERPVYSRKMALAHENEAKRKRTRAFLSLAS